MIAETGPTDAEIDALAGAELDTAVEFYVFGRHIVSPQDLNRLMYEHGDKVFETTGCQRRPFSTDGNAMLRLLDAMSKRGFYAVLKTPCYPDAPCTAYFRPHDPMGWFDNTEWYATGETVPEAVSRAAVKACLHAAVPAQPADAQAAADGGAEGVGAVGRGEA